MNGNQLTPPWDTDAAALNAVEMLTSDRFREDARASVWCQTCTGRRRRLVRVFAGALDDGQRRLLLLAPAYELGSRTVPALCYPVPKPGETWHPMYGHCSRCRCGVVVLFDDAEGVLTRARTAGDPMNLVVRFGRAEGDPYQAGDETTYVSGTVWERGPADCWLLRVGPPTLGVVVP
ncbi:MAG: hypothetical protein WBP09_06290 [Propionicimonas sp.]